MVVQKINRFYGYALYILGIARIILLIISFLLVGSAIVNFLGGNNDNISYAFFWLISVLIGFAQILLMIFSIPMIFINKKHNPEVVSGYLYGIGAFCIALFFASIYTIFFEIYLYMKAGSKIIKATSSYLKTYDKKKNSEWFFNQENRNIDLEDDNNNIIDEIKKEKKNAKLLEEIYEWRKLLDSGEIDEETYNEIKDKLLKKMKK